jgi:hypothetical protein
MPVSTPTPEVHGGNFAPKGTSDRSKAARAERKRRQTFPACVPLRLAGSQAQDRVQAPAGVRLAHDTGSVAIPCLKVHPGAASRAPYFRLLTVRSFPDRGHGGSSGRTNFAQSKRAPMTDTILKCSAC